MEMEQPVVDREKAQSDTNSEAARLDLDDHEQVCGKLNNLITKKRSSIRLNRSRNCRMK